MSDQVAPDKKILFYDIIYNVPEKTISPNTPVTYWSLMHKGLPFERKLIELADVASLSAQIGFEKTLFAGNKAYTFPAIEDPNTGAKVSDSFDIAEYLDRTYAAERRPLLVPPGTKTLQKAFLTALKVDQLTLFSFAIPAARPHVPEYSLEYFLSSRSAFMGKKFDDIRPTGEEAVKAWEKVKQTFNTFDSWFDDQDKGSLYITGDVPVLADFYLAARLSFIRATFGRNSPEWKDVSSWNNGRWESFLERIMERYPLV